MDVQPKVKIKCPQCGEDVEIEQWSAVNSEKNPEQKKKLLDGTLFQTKCEKCGKIITVGYPVVYHDSVGKCMIWLIYDDSEIQHIEQYFRQSKSESAEKPVDRNCIERIVRTPESLREKIIIFDNALDDKIVEIMKLAYAKEVQRKLVNDNVIISFFSKQDENLQIEIYTEKGKAFVSPFSRDLYDQLNDKYGGKASYAEDRVFIIDDVWAYQLLRTMR